MAILQREKQYTAGVFTPHGLYATSLPRFSEKKAIASVSGEDIERSDRSEFIQILGLVYLIMDGEPVSFDKIKFDFSDLTENKIRVLESVLSIPKGETRSYGQIAEMSGVPGAARFVGTVMATNRFAPIIPCHRVVAANGLGGYSGGYGSGVAMKRSLLQKEGAKIAKK